jgi:DNA-binding response OmpR family regulator
MRKMLIIEDEPSIALALEDDFRLEGFEVVVASDGLKGLEYALDPTFDIILLDLALPGMGGFDICKTIRQKGLSTPVIMLTAKSQEIDKILGLEIGADDYVTKPFSPRVLTARVKALLRRSDSGNDSPETAAYNFGDVRVDVARHEVTKGGAHLDLTALEFSLLRFFLENNGLALRREQILDAVWGDDVIVDSRTVDTHVLHLRQKLEDDPSNPKWILGIRGVGYRFVLPSDDLE